MKKDEYQKELKVLYAMAIEHKDVSMALELLERGRAGDVEDINTITANQTTTNTC